MDKSMTEMRPRRILAIRLLLSLFVALLVAATATICAWNVYRNNATKTWPIEQTKKTLGILHQEVESYRKVHGRLPERWADLDLVKLGVEVDTDKSPRDAWNRAIVLHVKDGKFTLVSLGG